MKWTKKKVFYTVMEALLIGVAPLVFVVIEYCSTASGTSFKIGFGGVLLAIIVLLICKRVLLKKWMEKLHDQISQHEGDLKIENDTGKIANLEREIKRARTVETLLNALLPLVLLIGLLLMCSALETEIIKLSGAVGFTIISFCIGTIFSVLNAREVVGKNGKKEN